MTLAKRIIPCLDIRYGNVVKGVKFESIRNAGDPVELAQAYCEGGADELLFLDISASKEKRKTHVGLARRVAEGLDIPFTIGGGISSVDDARSVLSNGADKVSVNTSAIRNPELISELSDIFGQQCVVVAIDAKRSAKTESGFTVCTFGGSVDTGKDAIGWAIEAEKRGAGEILLTSMDRDGTKEGFDIPLTRAVCSKISLPVVASGGCGRIEHFLEILNGEFSADAALAASVFHYGELTIGQVKEYLSENGITVRN
ncbi:MAG: imidazole glycerol phosphate synthase subunit HisF [Nitrososphaerales archaeon]